MKVTTIDYDSNVLQFSDLENNMFTIQDFKGKNLFINYWATWCNPCLAEMPYMAELYENYKDEEDIIFLYLSREKLEVIKNYIPKDESLQQLPIYKIITDDEFFETSGIPPTLLAMTTIPIAMASYITFGELSKYEGTTKIFAEYISILNISLFTKSLN